MRWSLLANGKIRFTGADGTSQEVEMKANDAMWSPAGTHFGENTGSVPIDAVIGEALKGNKPPTATIPPSRVRTPTTDAGYSTTPACPSGPGDAPAGVPGERR